MVYYSKRYLKWKDEDIQIFACYDSEQDIEQAEKNPLFIRWISDKEYEVAKNVYKETEIIYKSRSDVWAFPKNDPWADLLLHNTKALSNALSSTTTTSNYPKYPLVNAADATTDDMYIKCEAQ